MIVILYLLTLLGLTIYSYSQIDLNLTLFQSRAFLDFQYWLVQLGYFNRPLSTNIFLGLLALFSIFSFLLVKHADKLSKRSTLFILGGLVLLGLICYPAFSHDIFNYIFDARIFVTHHQNPYTHTALMFPSDDWTRFMNWTHRTYPYGPTFLPITIVFYVLGLGKFILTLLSFKLLALLSFLGSCFVIHKLAGKRGLLFFATNPLIIFELLITGHLDGVMLVFALVGWFFLMQQKNILSYGSLLLSIGIKYATVLLIPAFLFKSLKLAIILALVGAFVQIGFREVLPSYFIVPLGFIALDAKNTKLLVLTGVLSVLLLVVRYYTFISTGTWFTLSFF